MDNRYCSCYNRSYNYADRKAIPLKGVRCYMIKFIVGGIILYVWFSKKKAELNGKDKD